MEDQNIAFFSTICRLAKKANDADIYVPTMDGMLKPNTGLDDAQIMLQLPGMDCMVSVKDQLICSAGTTLWQINTTNPAKKIRLGEFDAPITFITASGDGQIAFAIQGSGLLVGNGHTDWQQIPLPQDICGCIVSGCFQSNNELILCVGSRVNSSENWKRDLMEKRAEGAVISIQIETGKITSICENLAFPAGIVALGKGAFAVTESWKHRVIKVVTDYPGKPEILLANLPAYPSRLCHTSDGGFMLALFAPRRQLFEMVLGEYDYREEMMSTLNPEDWVGPALRVSIATNQPLQQGSVRQMGIVKPWAPSRSYGLAIRCNPHFAVVESWHSRADGIVHGITSVCEHTGDFYAISKGMGTLVQLPKTRPNARP